MRFEQIGKKDDSLYAGILKNLTIDLGRKLPTDEHYFPLLKSKWYNVRGMGHSKVDKENKTARFYGYSGGYNIGISQDYLERMRPLFPEWTIND